jgi:serine/threonine-protein kinase
VPGYAEERQIGSGASGKVVAAVHQPSGTRVAIKYLAPRLAADREFLARFRAEASLLKSLGGGHVVRLLDYAEAPGQGAAIVMELVNGVSLHQMITRQGPAGPESALAVLKGSLLGLAAAHALGIVHGDYKPENVLVDADGHSKLTDFGVAVFAGQGSAGGTPLYMAPEQWNGGPATAATDIYAATAVFFECLTGKTPFAGGPGQLRAQHVSAAVPAGQVDEPLRALIARGMAKDPAARPANATAFAAELEATAAAAYGPGWEARGRGHLAERAAALLLLLLPGLTATGGAGGASSAITVLPPAARTVARGGIHGWKLPAMVVISGAVVAAVAGGVVGATVGKNPRPGPTPHPVASSAGSGGGAGTPAAVLPSIAYATTTGIYTRAGNAAPDQLAALPAGTAASNFAWSWDGRWLGWLSGSAATGAGQVHITDIKTGRTHSWPCAGCLGEAFADGHLVVGGQASLTAYPEDGGSPVPVSLSGPAVPGLPDILASTPRDASVLFFAGDEKGGALYEVTLSGTVTRVSSLPVAAAPGGDRARGDAALVAISPDRKILAYECNVLGGDLSESSDGVTIVDLATGKASTQALPGDPLHPLRISAVWVDSAGTAYAIAWHQPGNASVTGVIPRQAVVPHQYRLGDGHWTDTGARDIVAAGGGNGWLALLEQPASIISYSPREPGQLVAVLGTRQMTIAANVTTLAWAPSGSTSPG